ncbi:triose-phosphate isomerase [Nitrospira sp. Kam-Ns4a]
MRRRLIVGNWKMNKPPSEAAAFVRQLVELVPARLSVEVVLAPPFTALQAVRDALPASSPFQLGAQNLFWEDRGAYTGEVSAPMLADLGCQYVILGHSERRRHFGETDAGINKKVRAALRHGLRPILCVGESLADRENDRMEWVVTTQLTQGLADLSKDEVRTVTLAYEPVWAIGTGRAATPEQADAVHRLARNLLAETWGAEAGDTVRILYGGSVSPENIGGFLASFHVDGALVGGACLDARAFARIIAVSQPAAR